LAVEVLTTPRPPPADAAVLPETVEPVTVSPTPSRARIPPPSSALWLSLMTEPDKWTGSAAPLELPWMKRPPPP